MENIQKHIKDFKKSLNKLMEINRDNLEKIKDKEPEMFMKITKDTAKIQKAIKENDFEALLQLQKKYANNSDQ